MFPKTTTSRGWLRTPITGLLAAAISVTALAGCASTSPDTGSAGSAAPLPEASFQLGWIPSVESMAPILASSKGYFKEAGTDVKLLPGGPQVTMDAQIVSGNALMGTLSSEALANSAAAGAPLVAVGAIYQTSSSAIVTLASSGITTPQDLEGKRFGVSQTDIRVFKPFFKLVGVDESKVNMVTTNADPAALISGDVDAMSGTAPNQPVAIEAKGVKTNVIRLADFGYNRWSNLLVVRKDSLADPQKRATIKGMLKAITNATKDAVEDPAAAGQAVVDVYGKQLGLDLAQQQASAKVWAGLASESTKEQGVVRVTETGIASQQKFFDGIGVKVEAAKLFDLTVQGEK